jgi:hypothetical protein
MFFHTSDAMCRVVKKNTFLGLCSVVVLKLFIASIFEHGLLQIDHWTQRMPKWGMFDNVGAKTFGSFAIWQVEHPKMHIV